MIYLSQNLELYNSDFRQMIQAFLPGEKIVLKPEGTELAFQAEFRDAVDGMEEQVKLSLYRVEDSGLQEPALDRQTVVCRYRNKKEARNVIKAAAYHLLSRYTGKELPWGSMTGVRPTKFATARVEAGWDDESIIQEYETTYLTTRQKGEICLQVARREQELLTPFRYNEEYCLYVGIPFCLSRCLYCSFASYPVAQYEDRVEKYLDALFKELSFVADAYKDKRLVAIYMGGGTPTALSAGQLGRLIDFIYQRFNTEHVLEFTVEAGRPDSLDEEKFRMLKERPVTRISINPQTMNDETLRFIGRAHTSEMTIEAFKLARDCGMDNINMDMIVGLPNESLSMIEYTLERIEELKPDSLTVHSLALKRSAELNIQMQRYRDSITGSTDEMLKAADRVARRLGMNPYYLYRQKNIPGNLENVGYAIPGKECLYNILIMEEKMDIIAVGAGTSTKMVYKDSIGRIENVKNVDEYIARVDEMIERKRIEFSR